MRGWLMIAGALLVFGGTGCAKKEEVKASSTTEQPAPATATTTPVEGSESEGEKVDTSGSIADLRGRMEDQEHQLEQLIASGQLNEVHKKAFAIRDLVDAIAAKSTDAQKDALTAHAAEVRALAGELDEAGDSGDMARAKSEFKKLEIHTQAIESVLGATTR